MMRDLVARLSGQMRFAGGDGATVFTGWDMTAALALGAALGLPRHLVAWMLPEIEAAAVRAAAAQDAGLAPDGGDAA